MSKPIEVAIFSQNSIFREGLSKIVSEKNFLVTAASNSITCIQDHLEGRDHPIILLVDFNNRSCEISQFQELKDSFLKVKIVFLSDSFHFDDMVQLFQCGADGYIVKELECESLIGCLHLVASGEKVLPSQLVSELSKHSSVFQRANGATTAVNAQLTDREIEILQCLIMGYPNKVISRHRDITEATVKVHVKAILRKLNVQNRTQAAIWAINHGIEEFVVDDQDLDDARNFQDDDVAIVEAMLATEIVDTAGTAAA